MPDRVAAESVIEITWNTQEEDEPSRSLPANALNVGKQLGVRVLGAPRARRSVVDDGQKHLQSRARGASLHPGRLGQAQGLRRLDPELVSRIGVTEPASHHGAVPGIDMHRQVQETDPAAPQRLLDDVAADDVADHLDAQGQPGLSGKRAESVLPAFPAVR